MRVILFIIAFLTLIASFWGMAQAFVYPDFGFVIFGGSMVVAVLCLAIPFKWMRD